MVMIALATMALAPEALPKLTVRGMDLVDPDGKAVELKGCNLGNWFVIEPWMLTLAGGEGSFKDQHEFEGILRDRFGDAERQRLMDLYRANWITERDFPIIRSFDFNVVRLPMNYRLMEDDERPMRLRKDAWKWIDRAVDLAEKHGLYTILDMHGVQGGQSVYDHTGRAGQNKLWTEPQNQERLAWLWGEIAKRYRNRNAVIAYDVFNEPYGGSKENQVKVFEKVLGQIRKFDPDKLVYAHGNYDTYTHYGDPKAKGWKNVGFQMHYYPGLFGNGAPDVLTHARHLRNLEEVAKGVKSLNVPFLVGEMNVVFKKAGGASMMRMTYDLHRGFGWATTMWSYKVLSEKGGIGEASWGMVTNAAPVKKINIRTASLAEIESWMRGLGTEPYEIYDELRHFLTVEAPRLPPLPELPPVIKSVTDHDALPGWTTTDIGGALKGGMKKLGEESFILYGGGSDIWGHSDQFRFLHQRMDGDFDLEGTVSEMSPVAQHAKAGLMVRSSLEPDAAAWLLSVFPDGAVQFAIRSANKGSMGGTESADSSIPVRLRLTRAGTTLKAFFASGREPWQPMGEAEVPLGPLHVGVVALSHDNGQLVKIQYENVRLGKLSETMK